jgi:hypothetical protein
MNKLGYWKHKADQSKNYLLWRFARNSHDSVYFYTFHKCASTLFSNLVLKNLEGLRHIDYASRIYNGEKIKRLVFEKKGFVYGPIRLSVDPASAEFTQLVNPLCDLDFVRENIVIFLVRDPRDILVSGYYSFGYTHGFSPAYEIRLIQEQRRKRIQNESIDQYAMEAANSVENHFEKLYQLREACHRSVILKYEDMIDHWELFVEDLTRYVDIKENILKKIYSNSRPLEKESRESHRRSGRVGQFRSQLQKTTITYLNKTFESILEKFQYQA